MYLKKLKKIFCGLLMLIIAFGCVGSNYAFCITEDEKKVEELIYYVRWGRIDEVNRWLTENKDNADRLLKCKVGRAYDAEGYSCYTLSDVKWMRSNGKSLTGFRVVELNVIEVVANDVIKEYREEGERWHIYYGDINSEKVKECVKVILDYIATSPNWGTDKFAVISPPAGELSGESRRSGTYLYEDWKTWDVCLRNVFKEYADQRPDRFEMIETRAAWGNIVGCEAKKLIEEA